MEKKIIGFVKAETENELEEAVMDMLEKNGIFEEEKRGGADVRSDFR